MDKNEISGAVKRALKNICREHNVSNPQDKYTTPALEAIYLRMCGEPLERMRMLRKYITGELAVEQRKAQGQGVEIRQAELRAGSTPMVLEGYAALYNEPTNIGSFREMIAPGAFEDVLDDDVRLLLNHDGAPLARTRNNTLKLEDDKKGLYYRAELVDTQAGRDLYKMVQRGDITQSSFGFTIAKQDIQEDGLRLITKVGSLLDVSPVSFAAYENTEVYARKAGAAEQPEDIG